MKLGIMQPYFFPYIGYFDLINRTDRWIVFDVVQYTAKSWMNRNRVLGAGSGWQYITVPVHKHVGDQMIKDVTVVDKEAARKRILGQLQHYRVARAPFFSAVKEIIERTFERTTTNLLRDINVSSLLEVCEYLGISFDYAVLSETGIELPPIQHPGQWALEISAALGASEYVNPPGGRALFRPAEFQARGVALTFTDLPDYRYSCGPYEFVEHLSIIDACMWNAPETIKAYLDSVG